MKILIALFLFFPINQALSQECPSIHLTNLNCTENYGPEVTKYRIHEIKIYKEDNQVNFFIDLGFGGSEAQLPRKNDRVRGGFSKYYCENKKIINVQSQDEKVTEAVTWFEGNSLYRNGQQIISDLVCSEPYEDCDFSSKVVDYSLVCIKE